MSIQDFHHQNIGKYNRAAWTTPPVQFLCSFCSLWLQQVRSHIPQCKHWGIQSQSENENRQRPKISQHFYRFLPIFLKILYLLEIRKAEKEDINSKVYDYLFKKKVNASCGLVVILLKDQILVLLHVWFEIKATLTLNFKQASITLLQNLRSGLKPRWGMWQEDLRRKRLMPKVHCMYVLTLE